MGKKKYQSKKTFRTRADSVTIANKNLDWVKRALSMKPMGVNNPDGTVSSHVLSAETDDSGNWHVFPTLDYKDDAWIDMRVDEGVYPKEAFDTALRDNNTINFGKDGDFAIKYSENGLINHKKGMKNKKKFGLGTRQYLETPREALAENDIAKAKAAYKAETNPWVIGLETLGAMAMDYGMGMAGSGRPEASAIEGNPSVGINTDIAGPDIPLGAGELFDTMAFGGTAGGEIEAEGGEIVETPDGSVSKLQGAKHEQGGQDISIPDGTNIFSDRIFIKGKSIADRKEARTKKQTKLEKLLSKSSSDKLLKNSYEKSMSNFEKEEEKDLQVQDMIGFIAGSRGEAMFGIKSFGLPDIMDNLMKPQKLPEKANLGLNGKDTPSTDNFGNIVGVTGNLISGFGPLLNTMKERATDQPNINYYEDFGQEALDTIDESKGYVAGQKDNALKTLERSSAKSKTQNRNTARGVNTMRALDLATDVNVNRGRENIYDTFAKQMMNILGSEATAEMNIDKQVMTGEKERDIADRQDKAAYYTNLGQDVGNLGTSIQQTGKELNQQKQQDAINKILSQLSDYGITFDKDYQMQNPKGDDKVSTDKTTIPNNSTGNADVLSKLPPGSFFDEEIGQYVIGGTNGVTTITPDEINAFIKNGLNYQVNL